MVNITQIIPVSYITLFLSSPFTPLINNPFLDNTFDFNNQLYLRSFTNCHINKKKPKFLNNKK